MPHDTSNRSTLCYVDSRHVNGPLVDRLDVWTSQGQRIGSFEGLVIDAEEQRARFLVVDRGRYRPRRCLVPLPVQLDVVHQALRVDGDDLDLDELQDFDARSFPPLRDEHQHTAVLRRM